MTIKQETDTPRRALVTGGAGFIGSHLTDRLVALNFNVTVLDDLSTGLEERINPKAKFVRASICDAASINGFLREAEYVFHLAALPRIQPSFTDPLEHEEVNVVGTINLLLALKGSACLKKFVYSASSACYGTPEIYPTPEAAQIAPLSPYALQKYAAEQYALQLGERFSIPTVALRYFNVYGPRSFNPLNQFNAYSSVVGIFQHQRATRSALTITGDGSQSRDFIHVSDVVEANIAAALSDHVWKTYNVGSGKTISILELARMFKFPIEHIAERKGEAQITWADITAISRDLNWSPKVGLEDGLAAE